MPVVPTSACAMTPSSKQENAHQEKKQQEEKHPYGTR